MRPAACAGRSGREGRALLGRALLDYHRGERDALLVVRSDIEPPAEVPAALFFREPDEFFDFEATAVHACRGRVLDVGAGAGIHSLVLQRRGHDVTALDLLPGAARVMRERGVEDVRVGDVLELEAGPFDTLLVLLNGAGMAGSLTGLDRMLGSAARLLRPDGQMLLDSADPSVRMEPASIRDGLPRRADGRYLGEAQIQLEYRGHRGEPYPQLYVDPETLHRRAERTGWRTELMWRGGQGDYLARLERDRSRVRCAPGDIASSGTV